jgi:hypothetical protein
VLPTSLPWQVGVAAELAVVEEVAGGEGTDWVEEGWGCLALPQVVSGVFEGVLHWGCYCWVAGLVPWLLMSLGMTAAHTLPRLWGCPHCMS